MAKSFWRFAGFGLLFTAVCAVIGEVLGDIYTESHTYGGFMPGFDALGDWLGAIALGILSGGVLSGIVSGFVLYKKRLQKAGKCVLFGFAVAAADCAAGFLLGIFLLFAAM